MTDASTQHFDWFKTKSERFTTEFKRIFNIGGSLSPNFEWEIIFIIMGPVQILDHSLGMNSVASIGFFNSNWPTWTILNGILGAVRSGFLLENEHIARHYRWSTLWAIYRIHSTNREYESIRSSVALLRVFTLPQHWKCKQRETKGVRISEKTLWGCKLN